MKNTYLLAIVAVVGVVAALVSMSTMSETHLHSKTSYVPSDIANSLGSVTGVIQGEASWSTTDIKKVKDNVDYTIKGTVVHISEPIIWIDPSPRDPGYIESFGHNVKINVDIEVEKVGKAKVPLEYGSIVTVVITGKLLNDVLYLDGGEEHYELGEQVVVHIAEDPNDIVGDDVLYVVLGEFSKYTIQNGLAYNEQFPNGRNISSVMSEAR